MICLSQFPEVRKQEYDFVKVVVDRRPSLSNNLKVAYWQTEGKDCININLYDIKEIIEANTINVKQTDTYAVLMERDRLFAVNISAYPPANYFLFDIDVFLNKCDAGAKLDYISTVSGFFPLPDTFLMKMYLINRNEEFDSFFMQNRELISDIDED